MAQPEQSRTWRIARRGFRWMLIGVSLLLLVALSVALYLNRVGIPDFLKRPLVAELRERGVEADFSRVYWEWQRGVVIENLALRRTEDAPGPRISAAETEMHIHWQLAGFKARLEKINITAAEMVWPVSEDKEQRLALRNIRATLHFPAPNEVRLDRFTARFLDARLHVGGTLTNAAAIRQWAFLKPAEPIGRDLQEQLQRLEAALKRFEFDGEPELRLTLHGDAEQFQHLEGDMTFIVPGARTPWAEVEDLYLSARLEKLSASGLEGFNHCEIFAGKVRTPRGAVTGVHLLASLSPCPDAPGLVDAKSVMTGADFDSEWVRAATFRAVSHTTHSLDDPIPSLGDGEFDLRNVETRWGTAARARFDIRLMPSLDFADEADESWAAWARLEPFALDWTAELRDVVTPKLELHDLAFSGQWRAPELVLDRVQARLYDGALEGGGRVNVATRRAETSFASNLDPHNFARFLSANGQEWLAQYSWEKAPATRGELRVVLPSWTNFFAGARPEIANTALGGPAPPAEHTASPLQDAWFIEALPTLTVIGGFQAGQCAFRGVSAGSARFSFTYSNLVWHLPDIHVRRPEGEVAIDYTGSNHTGEHHLRLSSTIDVTALAPLLEASQQEALELLEFRTHPTIHAEVSGSWERYETIRAEAEIAAGDFAFRGTDVEEFNTSLEYYDGVLTLHDTEIRRTGERLVAALARIDFQRKLVHVTNVVSNMDPMVVTRAIGPEIAAAIEPYRFAVPPRVKLNGVFSMADVAGANLLFDVEGGPFSWHPSAADGTGGNATSNFAFAADEISGKVHWIGETLVLTNVQAAAYGGGNLEGWAFFEFMAEGGADFGFQVDGRDVELGLLLARLNGNNNPSRIEGRLDGALNIVSGNTEDLRSWNGFGHVLLREGFLWEIPVFGFLSSGLNAVAPGLGSTRAGEAGGNFTIRNGAVHSDDLEIRAPALRLHYRGSVDFEQRIEARVEAEILRDAWLVGRIVSAALSPFTKIFEYHVTGTLQNPVMEPSYVPKLFLFPLRPFHTLKTLLPENEVP